MRLFRSIFNDGLPLCHSCCHHNIDRSAYRNHIQINMASHQINRMSYYSASLNLNFGPQSPKSLQMLIDRPAADIAAAGKGNLRAFIFAKQRPNKIIGRSDFPDILIIYRNLTDCGCIDPDTVTIQTLHRCPDLFNGLQQHINVANIRQILHNHILVRHNRRRQNTKGSILSPTDHYIANQGIAAFHNILIHPTPLSKSLPKSLPKSTKTEAFICSLFTKNYSCSGRPVLSFQSSGGNTATLNCCQNNRNLSVFQPPGLLRTQCLIDYTT